MSGSQSVPLVVIGWKIFAHPLFINQLKAVTHQVEGFKQKDPVGFPGRMPPSDRRRLPNWRLR